MVVHRDRRALPADRVPAGPHDLRGQGRPRCGAVDRAVGNGRRVRALPDHVAAAAVPALSRWPSADASVAVGGERPHRWHGTGGPRLRRSARSVQQLDHRRDRLREPVRHRCRGRHLTGDHHDRHDHRPGLCALVGRGGGAAVPSVDRRGSPAHEGARLRRRDRRHLVRAPVGRRTGLRAPRERGRCRLRDLLRGDGVVARGRRAARVPGRDLSLPPVRPGPGDPQDRAVRGAGRGLHAARVLGRGRRAGARVRHRLDDRCRADPGDRGRADGRLPVAATPGNPTRRPRRVRETGDALRGALGIQRASRRHLLDRRRAAPHGAARGRRHRRTSRRRVAPRRFAASPGGIVAGRRRRARTPSRSRATSSTRSPASIAPRSATKGPCSAPSPSNPHPTTP